MSSQKHIVVIGAGVTGLTTSLFLAERGYRVTVLAANLPGDENGEWASPWAGAHWRTSATPSESRICRWDIQTYSWWSSIVSQEENDPTISKSGLKMQTSHLFWDAGASVEDLWWGPYVTGFKQISPFLNPVAGINARSLNQRQGKIMWAVEFKAPSLNVPQYLRWLQMKAEAQGVRFVKVNLPMDGELEHALATAGSKVQEQGRGTVDVFVNATGLGARRLCSDEQVHPIRGQTVLVKGEATATRTRHGDSYIAYCIARPGSGTTILGGTKEIGNWSTEVDDETTRRILERTQILAPELLTGSDGGFDVISVQCGLRPGREGGPRVEEEVVGSKKVVHAYGHGGGGYQNSIGSAREVLELVERALGEHGSATAKL